MHSDTLCLLELCPVRVPRWHPEQRSIVKNFTVTSIKAIAPSPDRQQIADPSTPNLFLIVQPTGVKSWAWRGRIAGRSCKLTLGRYPAHGLADAREWARDLTRQRDGGFDPVAERQRRAKDAAAAAHRANFTVDIAFAAYMDAEGALRKSAPEKLRMYTSFFKPVIGALALHTVERDDVEAVIAAKFTTHPPTSNRLVSLIKRFFRWCVTKGFHLTRLAVDPTANITKLASEVKRDRVLSDYEVKLLLTALREEDAAFAIPLKLLLLTGMRRSEVFEAPWDEFDLSAGDWLLPAERSKNGLPHMVPMPAAMLAVIGQIERTACSPLLFASKRTPMNPVSGITKVLNRVRGRMADIATMDGRTIPHWRLHDLRRTVATGMSALRGADGKPLIAPHEVEAVLNHVSGSRASVAGIYNRHAYYAEKKRALDLWAKKITEVEKQIEIR